MYILIVDGFSFGCLYYDLLGTWFHRVWPSRAVIPRCSCVICGPRYCTSAMAQRAEWLLYSREALLPLERDCGSLTFTLNMFLYLPSMTAAVWSSQSHLLSRLNKDRSISLSSLVKCSSPNYLSTTLLNFMNFINVFMYWGAQNWMQHLGMVQQVLSGEANCFPCCSSSAPVNAAQGALGHHCHQETLLAHMLLYPLSVHQVPLHIAGSHSVSTSSSARVFSFPAGALAICFQWSFSPFLQPVEFSVSGSPALKSVNWFLPV